MMDRSKFFDDRYLNRHQRRILCKTQKKHIESFPDKLTLLPKDSPDYPYSSRDDHRKVVYFSKDFLVQIFVDGGTERISVNRTEFTGTGWRAEITWDELQKIKREVGYGDKWCVECYPPDTEVVNIANMRHLWVLDGKPKFSF